MFRRKKKKGFTLIELLAVIVVLAVIILIAVMAIIPRMNNAKQNAFASEVMVYIKGAQEAFVESTMEGSTGTHCFTVDYLNKFKIDKKSEDYSGFVTIDSSGAGTAYIKNSKYMIDGKAGVLSKKDVTNASDFSVDMPEVCQDVPVTIYEDGTAIYFNPNTSEKCTEEEASENTSIKAGCMRWFTFGDNGTTTVNMLLDHDTTTVVSWATKADYKKAGGLEENYPNIDLGPVTVLKQTSSDTSAWDESVKSSVRLISASEIAEITGYAETNGSEWQNAKSNTFFFDTNTSTRDISINSEGKSAYAWLFENTSGCKSYGCNVEKYTYGYWTSDGAADDVSTAWCVDSNGKIIAKSLTYSYYTGYGVRPVITISKALID